jgi:predicted dehydrogenase
MKPVRVGIIRCDLHAIYYAALMEKHDPLMLRRPDLIRPEMMKYNWLRGGAYFYHYTNYADARQMTAPHVDGFTLTKLWDPDREIAEVASRLFYGKPRVCDRFEEVSDDVDLVFIADCNGDGSDHLKLATPGLEKRVPTFVDKPFAYDIKDALALVALARRRRAPVLSMSILRSLPEATHFSRRLAEVGSLSFGIIRGGGTSMAGHIHAISLAQHIFGNGVESTEAMGQNELGYVHLNYGGRKDRPSNGVMLNCDVGAGWHCTLSASAYGSEGEIHAGRMSDFEFPKGAAANLDLTRKMVQTRKPIVPYEDMLENIAVATAARKAQKTGRAVKLSEVWKR